MGIRLQIPYAVQSRCAPKPKAQNPNPRFRNFVACPVGPLFDFQEVVGFGLGLTVLGFRVAPDTIFSSRFCTQTI